MCLDTLIGLRGICETSEGLLINNLAGIDLKMISQLSNEDKGDYSEVWDAVQSNAIDQLKGDVLPVMSNYFKPNLIVENVLSSYTSTAVQTTPEAKYKGVLIDYWGDKFTQVYINDVRINLVSSGTYTIKIFDTWTGLELDSFSLVGTAGYNLLNINKEYTVDNNRKRLFIAIDSTAVTAIDSKIEGSVNVILKGGEISTATTPLYDNITFANTSTGGLTVTFNIKCSIDSFICQFKDTLKYALWYKTGSVLMDFRINSDRLNKYTLVKQDTARELRDMYESKYKEQLKSVLENIGGISEGICFPCDKKRSFKINLP